ncbi:MAG: hypothetical protein IIW50_00170, partial [Alistipes sp.]|nr:hypothetical protein [Alistipes sp.]
MTVIFFKLRCKLGGCYASVLGQPCYNTVFRAEKRIQEQIEKAGGKILGVVLNKVDFSGKFGYYRNGYGAKY